MSQCPLSATQPVHTVAVAAGAVTVEVFKTSRLASCAESLYLKRLDGTKLTTATDAMPVMVVEAVGTMLRRLQAEERIRGSYWSSGVGTATSLFLSVCGQLESLTTTVGRVRVRMLKGARHQHTGSPRVLSLRS